MCQGYLGIISDNWDGQYLKEDRSGRQAIWRGESALLLLQSLKLVRLRIFELGFGSMKELRAMFGRKFRILKAFTIEPAGDLGFLRIVIPRSWSAWFRYWCQNHRWCGLKSVRVGPNSGRFGAKETLIFRRQICRALHGS
jgi:hypothetical protein